MEKTQINGEQTQKLIEHFKQRGNIWIVFFIFLTLTIMEAEKNKPSYRKNLKSLYL